MVSALDRLTFVIANQQDDDTLDAAHEPAEGIPAVPKDPDAEEDDIESAMLPDERMPNDVTDVDDTAYGSIDE